MKKNAAIILAALLLLATPPARAFILFASGSSTSTYHADNLDNGTGTNVVLSGVFSGDASGLSVSMMDGNATPNYLTNLSLIFGRCSGYLYGGTANGLLYPGSVFFGLGYGEGAKLADDHALYYPISSSGNVGGVKFASADDVNGARVYYPWAGNNKWVFDGNLYYPDGYTVLADSLGAVYGSGANLTSLPKQTNSTIIRTNDYPVGSIIAGTGVTLSSSTNSRGVQAVTVNSTAGGGGAGINTNIWNLTPSGTNYTINMGGGTNLFFIIATNNLMLAAPTNLLDMATATLQIMQDATGNRLVTWTNLFKFQNAIAPTATTNAYAVDVFTLQVLHETNGVAPSKMGVVLTPNFK